MTTQTAPAPKPGTPEHDAAMIALAESTGSRVTIDDGEGGSTTLPAGEPQGEPTKPAEGEPQGEALILGKFKSQADLEAAYKALEQKLGGQSKPPLADPAKPQGDPQAPPAPPAPLQTLMEKAASEYAEGRKFSDETVAALEQAGIPRSMADNYVAGLEAQARLVESEVYGAAGGQDQYTAMQTWAAANLSAEQIEAFNVAVASGDLSTTKGAIANLKALYAAANGSDPAARVERQGGSGNEPPAEMYRSKDEVQKDMSDPRYRKGDRAWHAMVDRKLEAAMRAGIDIGF